MPAYSDKLQDRTEAAEVDRFADILVEDNLVAQNFQAFFQRSFGIVAGSSYKDPAVASVLDIVVVPDLAASATVEKKIVAAVLAVASEANLD